MLGRLRKFVLISLMGIMLVMVVLAFYLRTASTESLRQFHEDKNSMLARVFVNSLENQGLFELMALSREAFHYDIAVRHLHNKLIQYVKNLIIAKIRIFNLNGVIVYSSDKNEIGKSRRDNEGLRAALRGNVRSELKYSYNLIDHRSEMKERDIFESYIPIIDTKGNVAGVMELYTDVTDSVQQLEEETVRITFTIIVMMLAMFSFLFLIFYRTEQALKREEEERTNYMRQLEKNQHELESRVIERTADLDAARGYLQSIIDGIADPVMVIGTDLQVLTKNMAAQALVPLGEPSSHYRHCYQIAHQLDQPCSAEYHPCAFEEVVRSGRACKKLHSHTDKNSRTSYSEVTSTPLYDKNGDVLGIIEVMHDVSEVVHAKELVEKSEQRIRVIMDTVADAILGMDVHGVITDANLAAEKMFGYSREELVGIMVQSLLEGDDPEKETDLESMLLEHDTNTIAEHSVVSRNGEKIPVEIWIGEARFGGTSMFSAVLHDLSERKESEQELERTRQQYHHQEKMAAIGQLAAGILHEVGNPIASISGSLQAIHMLNDVMGDPELELDNLDELGSLDDHLQMIEQQINRLSIITREIADFASPRPSEMGLVDLNGLIRSTVNLMRYDRRLKHMQLELELDPNLPAVTGIADQITQVVMNLIINATDACENVPQGEAKIVIGTRIDGDRIDASVKDNGSGMDRDTLVQATEAFYTTKAAGKGTGLGLSLCDSIISRHNGRLYIESVVGEGTTVHFTLSLDQGGDETTT